MIVAGEVDTMDIETVAEADSIIRLSILLAVEDKSKTAVQIEQFR